MSTLKQFLQPGGLDVTVRDILTEKLRDEAEVIIQDALKAYERRLRDNLATSVIAVLERNYSISHDGRELTIRVSLPSSEYHKR